jgi:hypothetical protein
VRRGFGAVLLGLIVAIVLLMVLQLGMGALFPPPEGADLSDPAVMTAHVASMPARAFLLLIAIYFTSGLAGGWVAARVARQTPAFHGAVVGLIFMLAGLMNVMSIPHPLWVAAGSLIAQFTGPIVGARMSGVTSEPEVPA